MKSRLLATALAFLVAASVCADDDKQRAPKRQKTAPIAETESKSAKGQLPASVDVKPFQPAITLFDSVQTIKRYLETKAKEDYSDKYLHSASLHYSKGHPRKGHCWVYGFVFKQPRFGGDISIYHFMDGTIIEFQSGP